MSSINLGISEEKSNHLWTYPFSVRYFTSTKNCFLLSITNCLLVSSIAAA
uniref:Uncharacterized protein n=1 Tax=Wuchereria bancrofti TaxID=6293 RepID=A0AAF5RY10_WUCBA